MMDLTLYIVSMLLLSAGMLAGMQFLLFDCGILCLCSGSFFALSAYFTAILSKNYGISPLISVPASTVVVTILAIFIGLPLIRSLKQDFFALATLGFAQIIFIGLRTFAPGGLTGMAGIPALHSPLSLFIAPSLDGFIVALIFCLAAFSFISWLRITRFGALSRAVKFDENMVSTKGYNAWRIKTQAFAIAACMAALSGALQAHLIGAIEPRMASLQQMILLLCGAILSGRTRVTGALVGASFLVVIPELLQRIFAGQAQAQWLVFPLLQVVNGSIIIVATLILFPRLRSAFNF